MGAGSLVTEPFLQKARVENAVCTELTENVAQIPGDLRKLGPNSGLGGTDGFLRERLHAWGDL